MLKVNSIAVIIPSYCRPDLLKRCLKYFQPEVLTAQQISLYVTDDSPDDVSRQLVEHSFPWVTYLKGPGRGLSANRNNAIRHTTADWLFFVDDDCYPLAGYCEAVRNAVKHAKSLCLFEGRIEPERQRRTLAEAAPIALTGGKFKGANIGFHRQVVEQTGGFNENFTGYGYEEIEFHIRAKKAGYQTYFLKDAAICHPWRKQHSLRTFLSAMSNELETCRLHPELWQNKNPMTLTKIALSRLFNSCKSAKELNWNGSQYILQRLTLDVIRVLLFSKEYIRLALFSKKQ